MLQIFALAGILAFSTASDSGAPSDLAYLRCHFDRADMLITADEANSAVTVSLPTTGYARKLAAAFTATEVRFGDRGVGYVVNRVDLTATRAIAALQKSEAAKCVIETPPKRAF